MPNSEEATSTTAALIELNRPKIPKFNTSFPYAAQPDIIRANQKDVYYQRVLEEQVTNVFRTFFGTRIQHQYQKEVNVISDLFYFGLTTLLGTQTLGEEYCDIMQASESSKQFPSTSKRATLIFWHVILPYLYTRGISELRKRTKPSRKKLLQKGKQLEDNSIYRNESLEFVTQLGPHEQRLGYEILGFLLVVQFIIQANLYRRTLDDGVSNKDDDDNSEDEADLSFTSTLGLTPQEIAARKCTLCLSPRKNTTATPCGHLFCWTCIIEWC
ncbi:11753_t:CDS:2 [Funneliformis mosseae]|uniref:RING-type E3 ubiquitin transferase n=1 Tax=Funneliformis mosseae TaxID=27381 RepID=A0A9N9ANL4_FUNMO|nr:11753_t:CDS:2 [Funneliformis mosseae]